MRPSQRFNNPTRFASQFECRLGAASGFIALSESRVLTATTDLCVTIVAEHWGEADIAILGST